MPELKIQKMQSFAILKQKVQFLCSEDTNTLPLETYVNAHILDMLTATGRFFFLHCYINYLKQSNKS